MTACGAMQAAFCLCLSIKSFDYHVHYCYFLPYLLKQMHEL